MTLMARLERALGRYAIPDLTLYLVCGQAGLFIAALANPRVLERVAFVPALVLQDGQWWRLLTFPFYPSTTNLIFIIFVLWFLFFMGRELEAHWGTFRYNAYLLIAYLASVAAAFGTYLAGGGDGAVATSAYFVGPIFLAFAQLYPEFVIYLYLILPVKAKWLAWATWALYGYSFVTGSWMTRALVIASVLNFLLFFAADILQAMKTGRRRMQRQLKVRVTESPDAPFHTCAACGITDKTHPKMDFRYCPGCGGQLAYCTEHLNNHEHRNPKSAVPAKSTGSGSA